MTVSMVMEFKPPARARVLPLKVFRKQAFLDTPSLACSPALRRCSITLCKNNKCSITASRVCWTVGTLPSVKATGCWKGSQVPVPRDREQIQDHQPGI